MAENKGGITILDTYSILDKRSSTESKVKTANGVFEKCSTDMLGGLQETLGKKAVDFLIDTESEVDVYKMTESVIPLINKEIYVLKTQGRAVYINVHSDHKNGESKRASVNFLLWDHFFSGNTDYKYNESKLRSDTLPFLRLMEQFLKTIDNDCQVEINAMTSKRQRLWSRAVEKLQASGKINIKMAETIVLNLSKFKRQE